MEDGRLGLSGRHFNMNEVKRTHRVFSSVPVARRGNSTPGGMP